MNAIIRTMGLGLALLASGWVQATEPADQPDEETPVRAEHGWIRSAPPESPVRAGYLELVNGGRSVIVIDTVASPAFGAAEIHEMRDVDGVARMRRLTRLDLPPGERMKLQPGGIHLMLFRPTQPLEDGAQVTVELSGPDGARTNATLTVGDP
jgi:copper(I)-binding protein